MTGNPRTSLRGGGARHLLLPCEGLRHFLLFLAPSPQRCTLLCACSGVIRHIAGDIVRQGRDRKNVGKKVVEGGSRGERRGRLVKGKRENKMELNY